MPATHLSGIVQLMSTRVIASEFICLACGGELPGPLLRTASLRCHDCRDLDAPLRVEHAQWERAVRRRRSIFDRDEPADPKWLPLAGAA